jgi:serine/threonine protein kinase
MEGKILGNYRVTRKIGQGGMGAVYLARDTGLERDVAIKVISPELARNPALPARFRVEAIAQARLNHPNIVTIHSFEQQKDSYHIVMEYVEGKTLKGIIKETGKLPVKQALKIFSGLLEGMAYAHKKGVLHRDIKPANIYITSTGTVKIGDFGIAKVSGIDGLTRVGVTVGTLLYSSPEQIRGEKMGPTTDIYSLGVTLYEMLTGVQPFKAGSGSDFEVQKAHLEIIPQKPSTLNSEVPPALDAVVMKSLAKDPRQRFPGIAAFQKAIDSPSAEKTPARDSQDFKKPLVNNLINGLINIKKTVNRAAEAVRVSTGTGHVRHHEKKRKLLVVALISLVILLFVLIAFSFAREPVSKHSDHLNGIENINKNNEKKSCRISRTSRFSNISLRQKKEA